MRAVRIYGFEFAGRPLAWLINAFEAAAAQRVLLSSRAQAPLRDLVHPVFPSGAVFAWEVLGLADGLPTA